MHLLSNKRLVQTCSLFSFEVRIYVSANLGGRWYLNCYIGKDHETVEMN